MSDGFEPRSAHRGRFRPFASFLMALRFLTRMPVPFVRTVDPPPLKDSMYMFPVVGAVVGAIAGLALVLADLARLPELFCGLFALAIAAMITGAFHEDGLADVADGFGGGNTREERLEIMKDSRIGAFGTLTLIITILARASLLGALLVLKPGAIILLVAGAAAFSRALMVDLLWATRPARANGLSAMAGQPTRNTTLLALGIGGLFAGVGGSLVLTPEAGVLALVAGGLALAMVRGLAMKKIGGQTGDVCGAGQIMAETAMLAVYAAAVAFR
ncbi:adenosylcobinamide-GDP ribazoletransferase [Aestuariivirga litoralis]|uniref:Adenosylcobinamide-GDP ribazoletransferase n=2 Tax=Aestuariivirga litoralis TaxID=2650924 RepID=A0A2W2AVX3_9HYPH|nr:adenosylcobinamide-GDP ribazoletransferase [Aestuariivirga litoralis]